MDLQPIRSRAANFHRIPRQELSKWLLPVVIIINSSTDTVCPEKTPRPTTQCGQPGAQFGHSEKPVTPTLSLGDA